MGARRRWWPWVVVCTLLVGSVPLAAVGEVAAAAPRKITVERADGATQAELARTPGARLIEDYGAFTLWTVPDTQTARLAARASVTQRDDFDDIVLRSGPITPTKGVPPVPASLRQRKASGFQFWMVQFVGPVKPPWLAALTNLGIEIVIPMPNNAYVLWLDGARLAQLEAMVGKNPVIQWTGAYEPAYRLAPALQPLAGSAMVPVTVQFYRTATTAASLASVQALGGALLRPPEEILGFTNVTLELPADQLAAVAARADVFNVEPYTPPKKNDERQGQIIAGNITTAGGAVVPSGPGYLAWLAAKGFPTDPAQYPVVDIVDDGIDNGTTNPLHPDFRTLGIGTNPARIVYNSNCTTDPAADGLAGHGNLNAGIVGAYDNLSGAPSQDAGGYRLGLGVSPYTRIAGTKIFNNAGNYDISACGNTNSGVVANSYNRGANFTSNSWGTDVSGAYDSDAQAYDALTRDAAAATPGNQQMLHVFAAGNAGPGATTVGSPGTAKNVLTVGATENVRDNGVPDGCNEVNANNADDIATFSARGPTRDGRTKPDVLAPGTHITGPASQAPGYNGSGVCGAPSSPYYPAGQTLYTWSSGTSHSTPAVAGAAALVWNYYGRVLAPGQTPSPAMLKALLLNTPRYLNGSGTGGTLPSNTQGWGDVNLGALFESGITRTLVDQTTTFTTTGQTYSAGGTLTAGQALRVTLVWTDAPGPTTGNAAVNNLDLEVTAGGQTYKGNVFANATSVTGGTADTKNNVESIFLPAGLTGSFTVTVKATNLAGQGVPGAGATSQDFALVIASGAIPGAPALRAQTGTVNDAAPGGNGNGVIDLGETIKLTLPAMNSGDAAATGVRGTVMTTTPAVTIVTGTAAYPDIGVNATAGNTLPFEIRVSPSFPCGAPLTLTLTLTYNSGRITTRDYTFNTNFTVSAATTYTATDVPKAIPDNTPAGVTSALTIGATGTVGKVVVRLSATHTWDSDLIFTLIAPDATTVTLINRRGGNGDNFTNTVLDDAAATSITAGAAPFTGTYRPEQPLSTVGGRAIGGTWQIKVVDAAVDDTGTLTAWSLDISPATCAPFSGGTPTITGISPASGSTAGGTRVTLTGTGFTGASVAVDGVAVAPVSVSATEIVLVMPPHAAGTATIGVTTNGTATRAYTYIAPDPLPPPAPPGPPQTPPPDPLPGTRGGGGTGNPAPLPPPRP